ncbi:hypothetical protein RAB80_004165 [Fusarium oxysporum f. sp. vasinfectum]|nr:hypothetical protein RAB80_004165 [Fusarium oxysporum f. sp. vasinfectum]
MAELALAIIPLGLNTCLGLVSYLGGLKDRDDALARLKHPSTSQAATHAVRCLANCEDGLKDLKEFGDKLASNTTEPTVKNKVKGSYRKLSYPLRQAQLTQLENALDSLCTPLNLAVQGLHLELQAAASNAMILNATSAQKTALEVSTLAATISHVAGSISIIQPQLPSLQTSIDSVAPQINTMIKAHFKTQMDEIRASFQQAESTALQRHVQTAELLSHLRVDGRAIELTLRTTIGAGGVSISPSINYFAMVDEGDSPAFRVINLLLENRLGSRWAMESYPGLLFESLTRKLQAIFRSGRARPTDINSRGYSLLHHLTFTMNSGDFRILTQQQRAHPGLKSLFDFLIAVGTPVSAVGSDGRLALHVAADEFVLPSSILAQLCVDDADIPAPRRPELRFGSFGRIDIAKYDGVSRRIAEALFGPLTLAILRNDHTAILRQAAFADLDMVHTCSPRPEFPDESLDDRFDTATDDGDKATFIDSVIVKFRQFMLKDAEITDYEEQDDDVYLFRGTRKYHQRSLEFWDHVLPSLMENFEQTLASTWNPDHEALKDLGVTLWIEEEKKQEACARCLLSETLQEITNTKLQELSKRRSRFEEAKAAILSSVAAEKDAVKRLVILSDGVKKCFSIKLTKDNKVILGRTSHKRLEIDLKNLDRFLGQAKTDPSVSQKMLTAWEESLTRQLNMQALQYQYA